MPKGIRTLLAAFIFSVPLIQDSLASSCALKSKRKIISLSAPVSWTLYELGLLRDPMLDSVSTFHFTEKHKVNKIAGGLFLSARLLSSKKGIVFFDESRELKEAIKKSEGTTGLEVLTRGHGPFAIHKMAMKKLAPYLEGCDDSLSKLRKSLSEAKDALGEFQFSDRPVVFFLGNFKKSARPPRLAIGRDGFVDFFALHNKLKTYPSSLQYISWSPRILNKLSPLRVGVAQGDELNLQVKKIEDKTYNVSHAGALSPGLGQIRFMLSLIRDERIKLGEIE